MNNIKKIVLYSSVTFLGIVLCIVASAFIFKTQIIDKFINEANKHLNVPVTVGKIEVIVFTNFPNLTLVFHDIYVEDNQHENFALFTSKKVSVSLDPVKLWNGEYSINELNAVDNQLNMRINQDGIDNFKLIKETNTKPKVSIDLNNVKLENTNFSFRNDSSNLHHELSSDLLMTEISVKGEFSHAFFHGDISTHQIGNDQMNFLPNKKMDIQVSIDYNSIDKKLTIDSASIRLQRAQFEIRGSCSFDDSPIVDIQTIGRDTDIQTLLSLLPENISQRFVKYQSKGEVYFELSLQGPINSHKIPTLSINYGMRNTQLYHPEYKSRIENANFIGSVVMKDLPRLYSTTLSLSDISMTLQGKSFKGNFELKNLNDPSIVANFIGSISAQDLLNFYPIEGIKEITGLIKADVSLKGNLAALSKKSTLHQFNTIGSLELNNVNLNLSRSNIEFKHWNGNLKFNNNNLLFRQLKGNFGNSNFEFDGVLKNIPSYITISKQPFGIETSLKAKYLDIDQLLESGLFENKTAKPIFTISPRLLLNFNCNIGGMKYNKVIAHSLKGNVFVKEQVVVARNISFETMGGDIFLSGILDAKNVDSIDLTNTIKFNGVKIDSIFYVFDNFDQEFIVSHHLKGQLNADINLEATFSKDFNLLPESLIVDAKSSFKNGELNYFEPIQKLNKYLDDEGLRKMKFSEIKNSIHIEDGIIYIPQMSISSNVTTLVISGTHSFDQHIDYHLSAPLRNKKKWDSDEVYGAIEEDNTGKSKIFFRIVGTTDNYKIKFDKVAVIEKIVSGLKREVNELNEAFRKKGQKKKKALELDKDNYFDWDN